MGYTELRESTEVVIGVVSLTYSLLAFLGLWLLGCKVGSQNLIRERYLLYVLIVAGTVLFTALIAAAYSERNIKFGTAASALFLIIIIGIYAMCGSWWTAYNSDNNAEDTRTWKAVYGKKKVCTKGSKCYNHRRYNKEADNNFYYQNDDIANKDVAVPGTPEHAEDAGPTATKDAQSTENPKTLRTGSTEEISLSQGEQRLAVGESDDDNSGKPSSGENRSGGEVSSIPEEEAKVLNTEGQSGNGDAATKPVVDALTLGFEIMDVPRA